MEAQTLKLVLVRPLNASPNCLPPPEVEKPGVIFVTLEMALEAVVPAATEPTLKLP